MNGTQCTLKAHIWEDDHWPNHPDADKRMPACLLVEAPDYIGPSFFPGDDTRSKWIPLFPITRTDTDTGISRTQFPVILGWAITPWKAQGMTLRRVKVKIGKSVSQAGVLFTALSRVRHPDDMMLDDSFPTLYEIMQQARHEKFLARLQWERTMRVKFSRTLRKYMREPDRYSTENLWTEEESRVFDALLKLARDRSLTDDFMERVSRQTKADVETVNRVFERMDTFPYIFEVAQARGELDTLSLDGTQSLRSVAHIKKTTRVVYNGWSVPLHDFADFHTAHKFSRALWELFATNLRKRLPSHLKLHRPRNKRGFAVSELTPLRPNAPLQMDAFPLYSTTGYVSVLTVSQQQNGATRMQVHQHAPEMVDSNTLGTIKAFCTALDLNRKNKVMKKSFWTELSPVILRCSSTWHLCLCKTALRTWAPQQSC